MAFRNEVVNNLQELYQLMALPSEQLADVPGFTIHFLQHTFTQLPFTSVPFRPAYFSFLFIKDAFGKYTIDDHVFNVAPGTVYFTNPGNYRIFEWHTISDACLITFSEAFLKEYVHEEVYRDFSFLLTETVEPRTLQPEQFAVAEQLYRLIHREYLEKSPYGHKVIGSLVVALLLKIKEYFFRDYNPIYEGNRSSLIVKAFKRNLEQHFRQLIAGKTDLPMRVQDYADMQQLHVNYLSTVISSKTGKSVSAWIADKTIAEAKVLLRNPELSIKEIAGRLGFLENSHFSNYFRKHTSLSPAAYRKQAL